MKSNRRILALVTASIANVALALAGCTDATPPPASNNKTGTETSELTGPHADPNRKLTPVSHEITHDGKVRVTQLDVGNVEMNGFVAPVRGVLVTPEGAPEAGKAAPLILFSHLRAPNCADAMFAFPCKGKEEGTRFDQGMAYFGEALAERGYAVLIPDLTPLWVSGDESKPYSQKDMWTAIVKKLRDRIAAGASGSKDLGSDYKATIDFDQVGLVFHSRSAMMVDAAQHLFGKDKLMSAMGYGGSYNAKDITDIDPAGPDLPTFLVNGDEDGDVERAANWWLTEHVQQKRQTPIVSVQVPGYGHMFINRQLQTKEADDRKACSVIACPSSADHEKLLINSAIDWFDATIRGAETSIPLKTHAPIPATYAGTDVRWLVATQGENVTRIPASSFTGIPGKEATLCGHVDPMVPTERKDVCPEPENGVITPVSQLMHTTGAHADTHIDNAQEVALHILPAGHDAQGAGPIVTLTLTLANGQQWSKELSAIDPAAGKALASMKTEASNGEYLISTIRVPLPADVFKGVAVTGVSIESRGVPVEMRGVDVVGE